MVFFILIFVIAQVEKFHESIFNLLLLSSLVAVYEKNFIGETTE